MHLVDWTHNSLIWQLPYRFGQASLAVAYQDTDALFSFPVHPIPITQRDFLFLDMKFLDMIVVDLETDDMAGHMPVLLIWMADR